MEIITLIQPLYNELLAQKFTEFVKHKTFVRLCNSLALINEYTTAMNNAIEATKNSYLGIYFDGMENPEGFLCDFLNLLYSEKRESFPDIIASLLTGDLETATRLITIAELLVDLNILGLSPQGREKLIKAFEKYDSNYELKTNILISDLLAQATNGSADQTDYERLKASFDKKSALKAFLPHFVVENDSVYFFRKFAQSLGGYAERRQYIQDAFQPLIQQVAIHKNDRHIAEAIVIDNAYVNLTWQKAMERMSSDPEGAITIARTLIETVCKHILDDIGETYDDAADLSMLYKKVAKHLNLSPDQHTEQIFKQILNGCFSVVHGLGSIRNKISDAHAISETRTRPTTRHASLAVNLSGSVSQFLMETFSHSKAKKLS